MIHNVADRRTRFSDPFRTQARVQPATSSATSSAVLASVLTLVDTAQLVQRILSEAFPSTSFDISVAKNEHGSQLAISWTDGPRDLQVARLVMPLQAVRLADGGRRERVEHFMLTPAGRHTVQLAADRIVLSRQFSDAAVARVLTRLASRYADHLKPEVCAGMTVAAYRANKLHAFEISGVHRTVDYRSGSNLQTDVDELLAATTTTQGFPRSLTAARLFVRRDAH